MMLLSVGVCTVGFIPAMMVDRGVSILLYLVSALVFIAGFFVIVAGVIYKIVKGVANC